MSGIETKAIVDINKTANEFQSSIVMKVGHRNIDVKSILGLCISLVSSDHYFLEIHGPDEVDAKNAMISVFQKHDLIVEIICK